MQRDLVCKRCLIKVGEEITVKTSKPKLVRLCPQCKQESLEKHKKTMVERNTNEKMRKASSVRMTNKNPMFKEDVRNKVSETLKIGHKLGKYDSAFYDSEKLKDIKSKWKITQAGRDKISQRMVSNNPMRNNTSKQKMISTFKRRIKSGKIVYKRGANHHLWKGNRGFSDTLRVQLFPFWTKKCLERDNFKCCKCSNTKNLTVHHIKPLREFIQEILIKYKLNNFHDIPSKDWQKYFDEIINNHKLEDGITLCQKCHSDEDDYFNYKENN